MGLRLEIGYMSDEYDFPGYLGLFGPELYSYGGQPVATPKDYYEWHTYNVKIRNGQCWDSTRPCLPMQVIGGGWIIDCVWCKQAVRTRPDWRLALCGECGARYKDIEAPPNYRDIERILCMRPMRTNQNWLLGETCKQLIAENTEHGCRVPDLGGKRVHEFTLSKDRP